MTYPNRIALPQIEKNLCLRTILLIRFAITLQGRTENECLENRPQDVYFIGNFRPRPVDDAQDNFLSELINKLAPTSFGAEFELSPKSEVITIQVALSWACYYRVFPTLDQQRSRQNQEGEAERQRRA